MELDDTIVAIATPAGRGGIGVVRLSGPAAAAIAGAMLRLRRPLEAGRAVFGELVEPRTGERLDEVVATYFAAPHSYTTEDVVEISAHGSPVVLRRMVELALEGGARLATPGEFTLRAFLRGRIDLAQAEAVRDLIEAQTLFQAKTAALQLEGALSRRVQPIKQRLTELIAVLEAGVDFAEDDVAVLPDARILDAIAQLRPPLEQLKASFAFGNLVHEGMTLAIVGRPNVGKSSLFNRLVESDRAIVTSTPGTTRDLVTETVAIEGIPVRLVDTAGLRQTADEAESIGVRKSREALAEADVALLVLDASAPGRKEKASEGANDDDSHLLESLGSRRAIVVMNKSDLNPQASFQPRGNSNGAPMVRASALTGEGMDALRREILRAAHADAAGREPGFLTNQRQHSLVQDSLRALAAANSAVAARVPHEMLLLDLYAALRALDFITGATSSDDILDLIFSRFCIGK